MANPLSLTLMVDKSCNRVIYAESNGDFVDILLSFLSLPLGSIPRLTKLPFGSIPNLWESVQNLSSDCFFSEACRSMLLHPINSPPNPFTALPVKDDGSNSSHPFHYYYICSSCVKTLSFYPNIPCPECGKLTDKKVEFVADTESCFFIKPSFKFTISDDLLVSQISTELAIDLFSKMDRKQWSSLEPMRVDVTPEKILEFLKRLLVSDTPLTDVFLGGHRGSDKLQQLGGENCTKTVKQTSTKRSKRISMKLYLNKEDNTLLFCEAGKEFTELLASFLTYPMSSAVNLLGGRSGFKCIDNLYKSIEALKQADCIKKINMIQTLLKPNLPRHYNLKDPLIKIDEYYFNGTFYTCHVCCKPNEVTNGLNILCNICKRETRKQLTLIDPKLGSTRSKHRGEYLKSSLYMITDDLRIKQISSLMFIADVLHQSGKEITVRNLEIWEDEALALLRASMYSKTALTDVLLGKELASVLEDKI